MGKDLYDIGALPPIGEVPAADARELVRPERFGEPRDAIRDEVIDVPELGPQDALVAGDGRRRELQQRLGGARRPVDVTKTQARWGEPTDFHIVGSDASGVVYAVGAEVSERRRSATTSWCTAGQWDPDDPWVLAGNDPGLAAYLPRLGLRHVLGLDGPVHEGAGPPVPARRPTPHLGGSRRADAHRWHRVPDAVRLAAEHREARRPRCSSGAAPAALARSRSSSSTHAGGRAVAVVSSEEKGEYCKQLGAVGYVNRKDFDHWGVPPAWDSPDWKALARRREGLRQGVLGCTRREGEPADRLRPSRVRTRSRRPTSSATAAG